MEEIFNQIPLSVRELYEIGLTESNIMHLNVADAYFGFVNPEGINVKQDDISFELHSPNMVLTLWKNVKNIHITIL
jgi:hypothetical protein